MYLGSELFTNFANVNTASFVDTWVKFFATNLLWVIFPGIFVYESVRYLVAGGTSPFLVAKPAIADPAAAAPDPLSRAA
jgi:hypothetical protein